MSQGLNKCEFIGNLGRDPEIKTTNGGEEYAVFSMACNETWKDKDGNKQEDVQWIRCIAWKGLAQVIKSYVKKGSQIYIEGKHKLNKWTDDNGNEKQSVSYHVRSLLLLGGKGGGSSSSAEDAGPIDDSSVPQF